ncbi:MAG: calcium-binding protein, partial [Pseudomonadota bacterium]
GQFGGDTYTFSGAGLGADYVAEAGEPDRRNPVDRGPNDLHDTLDFTGFADTVAIDIKKTTQQTVNRNYTGDINLLLKLQYVDAIEHVIGSQFKDNIKGNTRNNILFGRDGDDIIDGKEGDNLLHGGDGDDRLTSIRGATLIIGGDGKDTIQGGTTTSVILGGEDDDNIIATRPGNQLLDGEGGNDKLRATTGDDILFGGEGDDNLTATSGLDKLEGGAGTDRLRSSRTAVLVEQDEAPGQIGLLSFFQAFALQFSLDGFFFTDPTGGNPALNDRPARDWIEPYISSLPGSAPPLLAQNYPDPSVVTLEPAPDAVAVEALKRAAVDQLEAAGLVDPNRAVELAEVKITVDDLPGAMLGAFSVDTVIVDVDAAGHGWFVDTTPQDNEEFVPSPDGGWVARADGPAAGRMDLLTTILHELGHAIHLPHAAHDAADFMSTTLEAGARFLPAAELHPLASSVASSTKSFAQVDEVTTQVFLDDLGVFASRSDAQQAEGRALEADEVEDDIVFLDGQLNALVTTEEEQASNNEPATTEVWDLEADDDELNLVRSETRGYSVDWDSKFSRFLLK